MPDRDDKSESQHIGADHQLPPPGSPSKSNWLIWTIVILALVAIGVTIAFNYSNNKKAAAAKKAAGAAKQTVAVTSATAVKGDIGVYLSAIGTVTPVYTAQILPQVNGVITAVNYKEGQFVHKGDDLFDIDARPYEAQLMQAQGALERDTNVLAQAEMDLERYKVAWSKNSINKQLLDDQEKIVLQDKGTVKNDQGTVNYDQVQVDFCTIKAPISGRVGLRLVDPGNVVQASGYTSTSTSYLVVITQEQPITVVFTIAEDGLGQVQARMKAAHTLPVDALDRDQSKKIATGKLISIDNQIDTTTGTVKLRAQFANQDGALFPNQFVNTRLLVNTLKGVTLLPTSTIQHNGQISFVYLISNGVASVRNVTTSVTDGNNTAVTGINPGEVVANSSFDKLQSGSKVSIITKAPPTSNAVSNTP